MIRSRIQIGDGAVEDFYRRWRFIYLSSDNRFAPPEKKRDSTSYAEEAGEHVDPRTVDDVFDYSVRFLIEAPNRDLVNANSKIRAWNEAVRERTAGSDVKRCRTVTFYNDYKRVKIVGVPEVIAVVDKKDFYRRQDGGVMDCVVVTLTIHVSRPGLCDFDTSSGGGFDVGIGLETDGESLFVNMSRGLKGNERLALLRRGRKMSEWTGREKKDRYWNKSRYRWHVTSGYNPLVLAGNRIIGMEMLTEDGKKMKPISDLIGWDLHVTNGETGLDGNVVMRIQKAGKSRFIIPCLKGRSAAITYGIAVYDGKRRVSEVVYFKSNVEVLRSTEYDDLVEDEAGDYINDGVFRQWLSV